MTDISHSALGAMRDEYDARIAALTAERDEARAANNDLAAEHAILLSMTGTLQAERDALKAERDEADAELNAAIRRNFEAGERFMAMKGERDVALTALAARDEQIAALKAALKPVGLAARSIENDYPGYSDHVSIPMGRNAALTHGELRRVIAALDALTAVKKDDSQ